MFIRNVNEPPRPSLHNDRNMQPRLHKRRHGSRGQQKERRAKHNAAIKRSKRLRLLSGPRIKPHQQEHNYEIL